MIPFSQFPENQLARIHTIFTDIDDTLTIHGRLTSAVLAIMERLSQASIRVVPVTGRPAGWCHGLARLWPIAGVIAENGAAAYWMDEGVQQSCFWEDEATRSQNRKSLDVIQSEALATFPWLRAAQDQFLRIGDIAFDLNENVDQVPAAQIIALTDFLKSVGLNTAVSNVHAHGYYGSPNKFEMTCQFTKKAWAENFQALNECALFIGDSGNDIPMFAGFKHSVGVANISPELAKLPQYKTEGAEGNGFVEMAERLLFARQRRQAAENM